MVVSITILSLPFQLPPLYRRRTLHSCAPVPLPDGVPLTVLAVFDLLSGLHNGQSAFPAYSIAGVSDLVIALLLLLYLW